MFKTWFHKCMTGLLAVMLVLTAGLATGCSSTNSESDLTDNDTASGVTVTVGSLKGPTSIGLVNFMNEAEQNPENLSNTYDFSIYGTPDELVPLLMSGDVDVALIPANLAATLYNRTDGEIVVLDINTLGVLSVVSGDDAIVDIQSLAGKTVLMTGKGTTPDFVMNYLLEQHGLSEQVTLEYKSEATEVAAALAADSEAIGVLPEPYATALTVKNPGISYCMSLTDVWNKVTEQNGEDSLLVTGVTVARSDYVKNYPEVIEEVLAWQSISVDAALTRTASTAELVVTYGILDDVEIAEQAIERCNLVFITGDVMQQALDGYLQVLYSYNPESVGGSLPDGDFYYR